MFDQCSYRSQVDAELEKNKLAMCLCLGPSKSGKTLLLKRLRGDEIEDATQTVPTNGVNLFVIKSRDGHFDTVIKEIGGNLAPMWKHYFDKVFFSNLNKIF